MGAGTTTYRVGEHRIGVRSTDPAIATRLRALLASHVVSDVEAPPNLSLQLGVDEGAVREFHFLYRGAAPVVRTDSQGRLLRATLAHLDGFLDPAPGTARLNARVLVRDGEAVLVDAALGGQVDRVERRIERLGYQVADTPGGAVDCETLEVVLWSPRLEVDADALAALERDHPPAARELPLVSARLPIRRVVAFGSEPDRGDDPSPARQLAGLGPLATTRDEHLRPEDLDLLRRLDGKGLVTRRMGLEDRELVELLRDPG